MKVKVNATGNIYHVENRDWVQVMLESGLIERVIDAPPVRKLGVARWFVNHNVDSESRRPAIIAICDECKAHQVFHEGFRPADPKTGIVPPSVLHKAFIEHCKKREIVPKEILDEYFRVFEVVMR